MAMQTREFLTLSFLASLREQQLPWHQCWTSDAPVSLGSGRPYRGVNNLLLAYVSNRKGYTDPRWLTFHQAQQHGWKVRKGEKAAQVEYWQYYDKKLRKSLEPEEVKRIQKEDPQRMKDIHLAAQIHSVFNGQQIDGIPQWEPAPTAVHVAELVRQRNQLVLNLGVGFCEGGDRAFYSPLRDEITLPTTAHFTDDYAYACTLLHEAGHATGHYSRLNRPFAEDRAAEELRAEIASAFTAQALGIKRSAQQESADLDQHKAYIQSWIGLLGRDPNALYAAIKDAAKISDYLIEHGKVMEIVQTEERSSLRSPEAVPLQENEDMEYEP